MNASVIIYGPPGCGKTRDSQKIAKKLGLITIMDGWDIITGNFQPLDHLYITNLPGSCVEAALILEQFPNTSFVSYFDDTIQNLLR